MSLHNTQVELTLDAVGERLDRALTEALPDLSRMQWQKLIREGLVTIDGERARPSYRIVGGESLVASVPAVVEAEVKAEDIPLDIRYEDRDLIVVNKPAGMVVHPSLGHAGGTLVNALLAHCPDLEGVGGERRPGIVHRLDKDTSGLIVAAKHDHALWYLQNQFKQRTVQKVYLALVNGALQPPEAVVDAPIGRDPRHRQRMAVVPETRGDARPAQTAYRALAYYGDYTLVECRPRTGRKHQLRIHLAFVGYPVVGDTLYGRRKEPLGLRRHFLHAAELSFRRPSDNELLHITSELPEELQSVLAALSAGG
ncbi:RluA family pseudouridine synthase [Promineifilum sp.]|uniref:RluA family pseudouridine synthase n=1 Tax=Promineifilum sp. TaxID=2664178 RepID=UPI0035B333F0